ncbi:hypothetical protein P154DRAFT_578697 [Amniculicola lignicola CBS 123094]|uniref:Uncharacterized protein n=1 Tax=Amniculicola lignicola CBS 123094 TaxID=1392246 RepID=A0A6A5W8X1_9PLEO|nr:hypothetical protein P154DRAFT_578697 [Amniculicola lignicola CBS 123094]
MNNLTSSEVPHLKAEDIEKATGASSYSNTKYALVVFDVSWDGSRSLRANNFLKASDNRRKGFVEDLPPIEAKIIKIIMVESGGTLCSLDCFRDERIFGQGTIRNPFEISPKVEAFCYDIWSLKSLWNPDGTAVASHPDVSHLFAIGHSIHEAFIDRQEVGLATQYAR